MRKVTLELMEIIDFKSIENETITFESGENWINLPNGSGKTTRYEAFCWVIFGKNTEGNSRFNIAPNNKENPQTKVTLTFNVDGEKVVLAKEIGKWYYNSLEVKKNVFEDFVSNIYNVETLEFLSNPLAFMNLHWETRRNYLTGLFCEQVSEDSEFSFLMKSMSISDIRKSKTKQKKDASNGLKRSNTIVEVYRKELKELELIDFKDIKKILAEKDVELEKLNNFSWSALDAKYSLLNRGQKDYKNLIQTYKETEKELQEAKSLKNDKGCRLCGTKISDEKFNKQKTDAITLLSENLKNLKPQLIELRDANLILKKEFTALEKSKPNEDTVQLTKVLKTAVDELKIKASKEKDLISLKNKIETEQKNVNSFTKEVMDIEGFMDRFSSFLVDNYFKSINENFEGLKFDVENECKCTNLNGVEFKDFSMSEKINAGVQIVSVLSQKLGLQFPLWIDNRESVTTLYPINTQVINLKVIE